MFFLGKTTFYGLCVIIPLVILGVVFVKLAEVLEKVAQPLGLDTYFGATLVIVIAVLVILLVCFLIGLIVQKVLSFNAFEEKVLNQIPGYKIIATIAKGFGNSSGTKAFPSVMVDLYGSGALVLGFIMEEHDDGLFTVFVPSSPVLTIGNVYIAKTEQLTLLDAKGQDVADCLSKWGMGSKNLLIKSSPK
ncbi:MAG: DUF502 domain-containing protein [Methyloprofundus sp.]|nr:DUF502 domain-containing protein [Methyloprofundus sp.]